jgi:ferredoxin
MKVRFGETFEFEARDGESILDLARRVNFPLAAGCFSGGCGVCKVRLSVGCVRLNRAMSRNKVSREEEAEGYALACCAIPETDVKIDQYTRFRQEYGWKTVHELVSLT